MADSDVRVTRPLASAPHPPALPQACGLATASLVLGILAIVTCLGPLLGIPAVVCGHVALSRIDRSLGSLTGRGKAVGGLVTGYVSFVGVFFLAVLAALLLPAVAQARGKAREVSCASNLKQVGLGVMMYASDYDGHFPPTLDSLGPYLGSTGVLRCPASGSGPSAGPPWDYEYLGSALRLAEVQMPAQTVVAADRDLWHKGGLNVLYADGHVAWVKVPSGSDWRDALQTEGAVLPAQGGSEAP